LLEALVNEGLLGQEQVGKFLAEGGEPVYSSDLRDAILIYLARSRARLMLVQLEDVISETEQANLPGTTEAHPNWRRHLSRTLEEILEGGELRRVTALVGEARRRSAAK
jgi:4-alpha-glucanotransferase